MVDISLIVAVCTSFILQGVTKLYNDVPVGETVLSLMWAQLFVLPYRCHHLVNELRSCKKRIHCLLLDSAGQTVHRNHP